MAKILLAEDDDSLRGFLVNALKRAGHTVKDFDEGRTALKGKGNMPAQGGGDSSDFEIARAVVFMANKGGAKFDEPKAPAAAASAAASATK